MRMCISKDIKSFVKDFLKRMAGPCPTEGPEKTGDQRLLLSAGPGLPQEVLDCGKVWGPWGGERLGAVAIHQATGSISIFYNWSS
jgi:hypothetical protein